MKKEKILITGGSGFVGTNFVDKLPKDIYEIFSLDIQEPKISFNKGIQDTINWYISNIRWLKYCSKKYKGQRLGLND